jgi:hypothetical protein
VTAGASQAELVLICRPFQPSKAAFVTARAVDCGWFRVVRDYFRDYPQPGIDQANVRSGRLR